MKLNQPISVLHGVVVRLNLIDEYIYCECVKIYKDIVVLTLERTKDNLRSVMCGGCSFSCSYEDITNKTFDVDVDFTEIHAFIADSDIINELGESGEITTEVKS